MNFTDPKDYREGAQIDQNCIEELFEELHFTVKVHTDIGRNEMEDAFKAASMTDHTDYDTFVSFVMSHGDTSDRINGSDDRCTTVKDLMAELKTSKCPSLSGKPKLFFFECCRGAAEQEKAHPAGKRKVKLETNSGSQMSSTTFPAEADVLLAFCTPPGYVAYLSKQSGSTYIQTLVNVIREHHSSTHLLDMLTEVNRQVSEDDYLQIPAPVHTLRGKVFL